MSLVLVMLTGLVVFLIVSPPLAIVHLLLAILLLGAIKRRMLLLVLVLKLSIELWRIPLLRCYGFRLSFVTLVLIFLFLCRGIVTIRPPSLLLTIPCSMIVPNILKLIVTSFGIYWWKNKLSLTLFIRMINWAIFSPSLSSWLLFAIVFQELAC